jgi:hypothetical protein
MKKYLSNILKTCWSTWSNFWFSPIDLYNVGLFRMLFGLSIFVMYLLRFQEFQFFYFDQGILPLEHVSEMSKFIGRESLFQFFLKSDVGIYYQGIAHLILLFLFAIGMLGRATTWVLFVINLGLIQRNWTIVYGADLFTNFWLLYLSFVQHDKYFSLKNIISKYIIKKKSASNSNFTGFFARVFTNFSVGLSNGQSNGLSDSLSTVGVRLIQIQLCLSYAYTGVEKFKGTSWWEGSAIWHVIGMDDLVPHDFSFLHHFPILIAVLSMLTIVFEVYFCFAVWTKKLKWPWLFTGFMMHLSIAVFMDLWFFFLVMTTTYLLFLPNLQPTLKSFQQFLSRRMQRL